MRERLLPVAETALGAQLELRDRAGQLQLDGDPPTVPRVLDGTDVRMSDEVAEPGAVGLHDQRGGKLLRDLDRGAPGIVGEELAGAADGSRDVGREVRGIG